MNKFKLTIAIPTYNRVEKLKKCLENILLQATNEIEIVVSDNCSTDGTNNLMLSMQKEHGEIAYYRNNENLGLDRNFLNCFEKSRGKYILLLGDDDYLLPGSIESILELLEYNPVFMHLNSCNIIPGNPCQISKPHLNNETFILDDKNDILKKMGIYITFMSGLVFKNELVKNIENKERYIGTYFLQSHIALKTMETEGLYIINGYNCLAESGNTTVSYDVYYVWIKCLYDLIINTGHESGFCKDMLYDLYHDCLQKEVLYFVLYYQLTCRKDLNNWNANYVWPCLNHFPDLEKTYHKVIDASKWRLKIYLFLFKLMSKFRSVKDEQ